MAVPSSPSGSSNTSPAPHPTVLGTAWEDWALGLRTLLRPGLLAAAGLTAVAGLGLGAGSAHAAESGITDGSFGSPGTGAAPSFVQKPSSASVPSFTPDPAPFTVANAAPAFRVDPALSTVQSSSFGSADDLRGTVARSTPDAPAPPPVLTGPGGMLGSGGIPDSGPGAPNGRAPSITLLSATLPSPSDDGILDAGPPDLNRADPVLLSKPTNAADNQPHLAADVSDERADRLNLAADVRDGRSDGPDVVADRPGLAAAVPVDLAARPDLAWVTRLLETPDAWADTDGDGQPNVPQLSGDDPGSLLAGAPRVGPSWGQPTGYWGSTPGEYQQLLGLYRSFVDYARTSQAPPATGTSPTSSSDDADSLAAFTPTGGSDSTGDLPSVLDTGVSGRALPLRDLITGAASSLPRMSLPASLHSWSVPGPSHTGLVGATTTDGQVAELRAAAGDPEDPDRATVAAGTLSTDDPDRATVATGDANVVTASSPVPADGAPQLTGAQVQRVADLFDVDAAALVDDVLDGTSLDPDTTVAATTGGNRLTLGGEEPLTAQTGLSDWLQSSGGLLSPETIFAQLLNAGFSPQAAQTGTAVALGESGGNAQAFNPNDPHGGSHGVMQINGAHGYARSFLTRPENNFSVAYDLFSRQGWRPWGAYTNGSYSAYLTTAEQAARRVLGTTA